MNKKTSTVEGQSWDPTDLLAAMGEAVVAVDGDQRIVLFNRAAEDLFGYPLSEVIGRPLDMLLPEPARATHGKFFADFARGNEVRRLMGGRPEIGGRRRDGSVFQGEAALARAQGADGKTIFIAILRDITERLRDRAELYRSNLLLAGVSRAQAHAIQGDHITDVCDEILAVLIEATGSQCGFLGAVERAADGTPYLDAHAVMNVSWDAATRGHYDKQVRDGLRFEDPDSLIGALIRSGEPVIVNDAARDPRGHGLPPGFARFDSFLGVPVRRGDELLGVAGIANRPDGYDASVIAMIEPVLTTHAGIIDVYRRNAERAKMEEQLRHARKMEAMGQLTGGVAHDFNNLLAIIQGHAEFLAEETGRDHANLRPILNAARRGAELTQRLLAFGRRQPLRPDTVELGALVAGMSGLLARTLGETIDVKTEVAPDLATVGADPGQIETALVNMAINARHAMTDGGTLTISCANATLGPSVAARYPEVVPGDYVKLSVQDTGIGMDAAVRDRAFEPFFTTREVGEGSGLGLSMVYGFARQSGGHATIESRVGKGTTVTIYLPRADPPTADGDTVTATDVQDDTARNAGYRVLVIEDEPDVRAMAMRMLRGLGFAAEEAESIAAARAILAAGEPCDLVLSDLVLPGGECGQSFAAELRRDRPDLKIVFMSGYSAGPPGREREDAEHDAALLPKPFTRAELAAAIDGARN